MKRIIYLIGLGLFISCGKLDVKPDLSRVIPSTLQDFQGILDDTDGGFNYNYNCFGEIAAGDFYVNFADYQSNSILLTSKIYVWNIANLDDAFISDWNSSYKKILRTNVVLEGLKGILPKEQNIEYNYVKGQALFHRALCYYMLVEEFAPVYDAVNVGKPAIPLRTSADINLSYPLSTVSEVYNFIVSDLITATDLLTDNSVYKTRPSRAAALGLLARVYLAMDDYKNALKYAGLCLKVKAELLDYNLINANSSYPIPQLNEEVIFQGSMLADQLLFRNVLKVQLGLYDLYENGDLRKDIFFLKNSDQSIAFKGNYNGLDFSFFAGLAIDEIYLIEAECHARLNNVPMALETLNKLLKMRYKTGFFIPVEINNQDGLLMRIFLERRKELLFRGLRWTDLRRLNKDPRFAVTLTRELNAQTYTLPPNDPRYVFPIPKYVTTIKY
ncbi:RagB/SusD family nutrient uptake outer membrane protein [Pedobacter helvus]|uniref:RagB/SusD family nutrient uptake outer membrane protein n=1 Tax=Pedobacter helvus TaxID=2563444 RepID=A0ABW9JCM9_9SPHI|nr:RagB/SusD family nutrient uptake outer membrane protein [Pedobacter ureilyticus]